MSTGSEKLKIEAFKAKGGANQNTISYWLYHEKGNTYKPDPTEISKEPIKSQCFASVTYNGASVGKNRLCYTPNKALTDREAAIWINLCIETGLLPGIIGKQKKKDNKYVLDTEAIKSLLYVYLCNVRMIAEGPDICRAVSVMYRKDKIDIYTAVAFAVASFQVNNNHQYLASKNLDVRYGINVSQKCISYRTVRGFRDFMKDPAKYDIPSQAIAAFPAIDSAISQVNFGYDLTLNLKQFNHPLIIESLRVDCPKKAAELVEKYQKEKP